MRKIIMAVVVTFIAMLSFSYGASAFEVVFYDHCWIPLIRTNYISPSCGNEVNMVVEYNNNSVNGKSPRCMRATQRYIDSLCPWQIRCISTCEPCCPARPCGLPSCDSCCRHRIVQCNDCPPAPVYRERCDPCRQKVYDPWQESCYDPYKRRCQDPCRIRHYDSDCLSNPCEIVGGIVGGTACLGGMVLQGAGEVLGGIGELFCCDPCCR
ncbi:hypothetical protein COU57_05525 [Candidatus Pacearchaeota archaeon CG10_big_fil_rev_8_21_14_0_10_32_14]|nr:MAG: hypothetical protein COU57_05525 [Candidatus Pacearchaeota archaeon CG10_big_fil_rev_8_21_14_0_10_32_14]